MGALRIVRGGVMRVPWLRCGGVVWRGVVSYISISISSYIFSIQYVVQEECEGGVGTPWSAGGEDLKEPSSL